VPVTAYTFLLTFARMYVHAAPLERVLDALSSAVTQCTQAIREAEATGDEEHLNDVGEQQSDIVEGLLGAAFVVAQAHINGVVASMQRLAEHTLANGHPLTSCSGQRREILRIEPRPVGASPYTRVEVINAMANFFKHKDEWTVPWSHLKKPEQKNTAKIVLAIGGRESSTGNLRIALKALDIDPDRLTDLHAEIFAWGTSVLRAVQLELRTRGLVGGVDYERGLELV
jgi:hypothetical protein